jgi:hypothetical protein
VADTASVFTKNFERPANSTAEGKKRGVIATQIVANHKNKFQKLLSSVYQYKR